MISIFLYFVLPIQLDFWYEFYGYTFSSFRDFSGRGWFTFPDAVNLSKCADAINREGSPSDFSKWSIPKKLRQLVAGKKFPECASYF